MFLEENSKNVILLLLLFKWKKTQMNLWKYHFDMGKQVHFIPFNIEDKFPFRLEFIEKTVFKNTYQNTII